MRVKKGRGRVCTRYNIIPFFKIFIGTHTLRSTKDRSLRGIASGAGKFSPRTFARAIVSAAARRAASSR